MLNGQPNITKVAPPAREFRFRSCSKGVSRRLLEEWRATAWRATPPGGGSGRVWQARVASRGPSWAAYRESEQGSARRSWSFPGDHLGATAIDWLRLPGPWPVSCFGDRITSLDALLRGDRGWVRDHRGCGDRDGARLRTAAMVWVTVPGAAVRRCVPGIVVPGSLAISRASGPVLRPASRRQIDRHPHLCIMVLIH